MNTTKLLTIYSLIAAYLTGSAYAEKPQVSHTTIQILIDDSGLMRKPKDAQAYKNALISHLSKLPGSNMNKAHVDVISLTSATNIFSSKAYDLKKSGLKLSKLSAQKPNGCSNLSASFARLKSNLMFHERAGVKDAHIIGFSSFIDAPSPCHSIRKITLPQQPPVNGGFNEAIMSSPIVRSFTAYWVYDTQVQPWVEFLTPARNWLEGKGGHLRVLDTTRSQYELQKGIMIKGGR